MERGSKSRGEEGAKRSSDGIEREQKWQMPRKRTPFGPPRPPTDAERQIAAEESVNMFRQHIALFIDRQVRLQKKWPPGMRMRLVLAPRDDELILQFLRPKVMSIATACVPLFPEYDVFSTEPWNLPFINPGAKFGYNFIRRGNEMYFFQRKSANPVPVEEGYKRFAGQGYWECYRHYLAINDYDDVMVGWKDFYEFKINDGSSAEKSGWIMEAYNFRRARKDLPSWMICKIYDSKKEKNRVDGADMDNWRLPVTDADSQLPNVRDVKRQIETANIISRGVNAGSPDTSFSWTSSESSDESISNERCEESSESDLSEESTD